MREAADSADLLACVVCVWVWYMGFGCVGGWVENVTLVRRGEERGKRLTVTTELQSVALANGCVLAAVSRVVEPVTLAKVTA